MTSKKVSKVNWVDYKRGIYSSSQAAPTASIKTSITPFGGLENHHEKRLPLELRALCRK
jgi:hypothetical protein